jgi:hypothetical protein
MRFRVQFRAALLVTSLAGAATLPRCAPPPAASRSPAPVRTPALPHVLAEAEQAAADLAAWLLLDADQKRKVRDAALRLIESNIAVLSAPARNARGRLRTLQENSVVFERELTLILTPDQRRKYTGWKLQFGLTSPRSFRGSVP